MRGHLVRVALCAALAASVTAAPAQAAGPIEAQCNAKSGSYLFWPHGHDARPKIGFPAFTTPHLELYQGIHTTSFPNSAQDAYIDAAGNAGAAKKCRSSSAGFINAAVNHARTLRAEAEVTCKFGGLVSYRMGKAGGGARLQTVLSGGGVVVDVHIGAHSSSIRFDKRYCKAHDSPR